MWDSDQQDLNSNYEALLSELETYVDQQIVQNSIGEIKAQIKGFSETMSSYASATVASERSGFMTSMISIANGIKEQLIDVADNPNRIQFIPVASSFIPLHMVVLKEQYLHGCEIYGSDADQENWKKDLIRAHGDYRDYFTTNYPLLKQWRTDQIKYHPRTEYHLMSNGYDIYANVQDQVLNHTVQFQSWRSHDDVGLFNGYKADIQNFKINDWETRLNDQLLPYYYIDSYLPENIDNQKKVCGLPLDSLNELSVWPMTTITFHFNANQIGFGTLIDYNSWTRDNNPGFSDLIQLELFKNDEGRLCGLQASYNDFKGSEIGKRSGNSEIVDLSSKKLATLQAEWIYPSDSGGGGNMVTVPQIVQLGFIYSDGTSTNALSGDTVMEVVIPSLYAPLLINGTQFTNDYGLVKQLAIGYKFVGEA